MGSTPSNPFTFLDLFSGCGGFSSGLQHAGGTPLAAVELSPMAATSWAVNHLTSPPATTVDALADWAATTPLREQLDAGIVCADVDSILEDPDASAWLQTCGADVVVGGPPCKGFSTNGRRDPADPRNLLVWSFLDAVQLVQPKVVVIENVTGMQRPLAGQDVSTFTATCEQLARMGYVVQPCLVDATHYATPQRRQRVLVIGLRADIAGSEPTVEPLWDSSPSLLPIPLLAPVPTTDVPLTVADALADLDPDTGAYREDNGSEATRWWRQDRRSNSSTPPNSGVPAHTDRVTQRMRLYHLLRDLGLPKLLAEATISDDPSLLSPLEEVTPVPGGICNDGESLVDAAVRLGTRKRTQRALRLDEPAPTLCTLPDDLVHPARPRRLTVREYARLQGFDDTFQFVGKDITGGLRRRVETPTYSQIGNAVPPTLGAAIGQMITTVLATVTQPA